MKEIRCSQLNNELMERTVEINSQLEGSLWMHKVI